MCIVGNKQRTGPTSRGVSANTLMSGEPSTSSLKNICKQMNRKYSTSSLYIIAVSKIYVIQIIGIFLVKFI